VRYHAARQVSARKGHRASDLDASIRTYMWTKSRALSKLKRSDLQGVRQRIFLHSYLTN
jgi:hypothetical protein